MEPGADGARKGMVTLDQVAQLAGVSPSTVSRVVNGNPRVGSDARRSVERAIQRLGYVPNRVARSLATRRNDSIGVVIAEAPEKVFEDPFFPRVLRGVSTALGEQKLQLILLMPEGATEVERAGNYLAGGHVDGVLLVSLHSQNPLPAQLAALGLPVVSGGRPQHAARVSYVDVDNRGGASMAVAHLIAAGRRMIATISGPRDMPVGLDRLHGYRDALTQAGVAHDRSLEEEGNFTQASGYEATKRLLARCAGIDGIFVASDLMASGALRALVEAGRRIPDDVAIVGFDDSWVATSTHPPLTTVRQPIEEMGREMVRLLLHELTRPGAPPRSVILGTELVIRASSQEVVARK